ncbi:MAG TPA: dienelactone hydrolase family protein [Allosphingosinicella sp.]|nr:dienelactone hydrolase family protein [Allosphingosinicella sp.]
MSITSASRLAPASGRAPRQIVLLLHGYGSNGADLISLAPHWRPLLPDALFVAPNAPGRVSVFSGGYQWWELTNLAPQALARGAAGAAAGLDAYIDSLLDEHGLTEERLAIVGFSQGTMMALHVGVRRSRQIAGIVGYSGMLTGAATLAHEVVTKPPVLLVHGSSDSVVPVAALDQARNVLERLGFDVAAHICQGLGHSVDPAGLRLGGEFVRKVLGGAD